MRKLAILVISMLILALLVGTVGCGDGNGTSIMDLPTTPVPATQPPQPTLPPTDEDQKEVSIGQGMAPLTDREQAQLIQIALDTPEAKALLADDSAYWTRVGWIGIVWRDSKPGEWWSLTNEQIAHGLPEFVPTSARIYPGVSLGLEEPGRMQLAIAIDRKTQEVVDVQLQPPGPSLIPLPVKVDAAIAKNIYLPGEEIEIELSFKNVSSEPFQIEPFPPLIQVQRPRQYQYEPVRSFPEGTGTKSLDPGEVTSYTLTWDQRDSQQEPVAYGYYYLDPGLIQFGDRSMKLNFVSSVKLLILPAEGAMEKTVEMYKSQTVDGNTFTLQRVELSTLGMEVYAFNTPPDYIPPQHPILPPPTIHRLDTYAHYALDGGLTKDAGSSGIRFLENGIRHHWQHLDPIPNGTKELTFIITQLGDWEGRWEFHVPLE